MPSSSAAINAIDARLPPMSGLPVSTMAVPFSLRLTVALDASPMLNQYPVATPRPWFLPVSLLLYCGLSRIASSVSFSPCTG